MACSRAAIALQMLLRGRMVASATAGPTAELSCRHSSAATHQPTCALLLYHHTGAGVLFENTISYAASSRFIATERTAEDYIQH
jgi:hypothetical protein